MTPRQWKKMPIIKKLSSEHDIAHPSDTMQEAADRIEALEAEVARLRDADAAFERVWSIVKNWDISTEPGSGRPYEGINGDHVRAIVRAALDDQSVGDDKAREDVEQDK